MSAGTRRNCLAVLLDQVVINTNRAHFIFNDNNVFGMFVFLSQYSVNKSRFSWEIGSYK
jgi:hypothetical protein